jgi:hypothetical protein
MKQTPKEKAKELFDHYYILIQEIGGEFLSQSSQNNVHCFLQAKCKRKSGHKKNTKHTSTGKKLK